MTYRMHVYWLFVTMVMAAAGEPLTPGNHLNIESGVPGARYAMRLPKDYAESQRMVPVLFSMGEASRAPGGSAESWADDNDMIIVSMEGVVSAKSQADLERAAAAITGHLEKTGVRMHPTLRYAFGFSAGGMAAAAMARADPKHFAGVALLAHSGNGVMVPKNIAVAFYAGRSDTTHSFETISRTANAYRAQGNLVRMVVHEGGHEGAPGSAYVDLLDWLYLSTCLSNPALSATDRLSGSEVISKRVESLKSESDLVKRMNGCKTLLDVAGVASSPAGKQLRLLWAQSTLTAVEALTSDPVAAHNTLVDLTLEPQMTTLDDKFTRASITSRLQQLRKDKSVAQDYAARQSFAALKAREEKTTSKSAIRELADAYAAIAKRFPDSTWGRNAGDSATAWSTKLTK